MTGEDTNWKRMSFKGNKVWARTDDTGNIAVVDNKVVIKYNPEQPYEYKIKHDNLKTADPENLTPSRKKKTDNPKSIPSAITPPHAIDKQNAIHVYTDGASSGNPGPSGIGVYLKFGKHEKKISKSIGLATNNIAELEAIRTALAEIKNKDIPVIIYTDSSYALGLLSKNWKPQKNQALVAAIKTIMAEFKTIAFEKVKGHCGIEGNEIADTLAVAGIKKGNNR